MRPNDRIMLNWIVLIARAFGTIVLSLITVRIVLATLGAQDYGLYTLLLISGGTLYILSDALSASVSRHLAFEIGRGDRERFAAFFSTSFVIYLIVGLLLMAAGFALADPLIDVLTVPDDRTNEAITVFRISIVTVMVTMISTPFRAALDASQMQYLVAILSTAGNLVRLLLALLLSTLPFDALVLWSIFAVIADLVVQALTVLYCMRKVPGTIPGLGGMKRELLPELINFGFWQFLFSISWRMRMQFAQIAINKLFGTTVNASYGIGQQVAGVQSTAATAGHKAITPAVITSTGAEASARVRTLVLSASRYMFVMTAVFTVPIVFEARTLLTLWLGEDRVENELPNVVQLTQLICIWWLIGSVSNAYNSAMLGIGRIGMYSVVTLCIDFGSLAAAIGIILVFESPPTAIPASIAVAMLVHAAFRATYVGKQIGLPASAWLKQSVLPCLYSVSAASLAGYSIILIYPETTLRVLITSAASIIALGVLFWITGVTPQERKHFANLYQRIRQRISRR